LTLNNQIEVIHEKLIDKARRRARNPGDVAKKQSDAPVLWCTAAANVSQTHLSTKL
jgi:hypothetical protein